ncbi:MAG TPA: amino acid ABC transporter permease [Micromonosporaceae bacterium]|nr:amino acid ABC transporter permease [Micromonosporaceae bacterium]
MNSPTKPRRPFRRSRRETDPSAVLYDIPGPRARLRNRGIGLVSTVVIAGLLYYVIYQLWETGQFDAIKWQQFTYENIQIQLLNGLLATLKAAGIAVVLALVFGAVFAAGRLSDHALFRAPAGFVVELFRAVPLLILMFFAYYGTKDTGLQVSPLAAVVFGLTLYNGSVLAEIFRAGVLAVPKGQSEAAYALGMRKTQVMTLILMPQAIRTMLPSIVSQMVVLLKDTALGFIITYEELLYVAKQIGSRLVFGFPYVPTYLVVAVIYVGMCAFLSWFAHWLERWLRERGRRTGIPVAPARDPAMDMSQGPPGV